jgi:hypothetical protein
MRSVWGWSLSRRRVICSSTRRPGSRQTTQAAADSGQELGTQHGADSRDAQDDVGELVLAKPALDDLVHLGDLLVEGHHLLGQGVDELRDGLLAGDRCVLVLGGVDGRLGQSSGVADLAVGQPLRQPGDAGATDDSRSLVAGQQAEWAGVGDVQGSFQGREHAQQGAAQSVDDTGAVLDQVGTASGQQL